MLDIQVFERGDKRLGLETPGGPCCHRRVADGAFGANSDDVAPQRRPQVASLISGLSHATNVETATEVNAVQDLTKEIVKYSTEKLLSLNTFLVTVSAMALNVIISPCG